MNKLFAYAVSIVLGVLIQLQGWATGATVQPDPKASRTAVQKKIDSHLLEAHQNIGLRKSQGDSVADVFVAVRISCSDVLAMSNAVLRLGGKVIDAHKRYRCVNARVPVEVIEKIAADPDVTHVRTMPRCKSNKVNTSEGVSAHLVDEVRSVYGLTGKGIKVGVLSDSVDFLGDVQATGDLPDVTVLEDDWADGEGTAMLEIVHDMAPDAELYFATAWISEESFAENIRALANAGCNVIVDDISYFDEPAFQDGIVAQAVADVTSQGCLYFSSAGNSGSLKMGTSGTFEGDFVDTDGDGYMNFPDGKNYIELSECSHHGVLLQWSDPWGASSNDYDLLVEWPDGTVSEANNTQDGDDNPYEQISRRCNGTCNGAKIKIRKYSGADRYIRIDTIRGRLIGGTAGNTYGHNACEMAITLGAASATANSRPFSTSAVMEDFSSDGPRHMFFSADGSSLTPGNLLASGGRILQKPNMVAADDVSCVTPGFNPFKGTSASAPHAAAIAALMLEKKPNLTRNQLLEAWANTSWQIDGPSWNECSGHGIINAKAAVEYMIANFDDDPQPTGDLLYTIVDSSYAAVTGYVGSATSLTIPETLGGYPVEVIGGTAFMENATLEEVVLPSTCNNVNTWAFYSCVNLRKVTFGFHDEDEEYNCVYISDDSFEACPNLTVSVDSDVAIIPWEMYLWLEYDVEPSEYGVAVTADFVRKGYSGSPCWYSERWGEGYELQITESGWWPDEVYAWSYWDGDDSERPENDDFADAIELWDESGYEYGSNVGATTEPGEPDHAGYGSKKTVWWTWTAPNEGIVGIDVWDDPYSGLCSFDTALAVYTGDSLAALELVCYSSGYGVHVSFQAVAGETYHIAVCGKGDAEGSFDLNWNLEPLVQEFGDWQYKIYDSKYASVVGYVGTATTLEVPETLGGYPVTEIGICAFKGNENLTDVVLPKDCREILSGAFADCINLSTLRISFHDENENDNWISITDYSLYNCPNLTVRVNSDVEIVQAGYGYGCAVTARFVREGYSGAPRWFSGRGGMGDELTISTAEWFSDTWVAWSYWDGTPEPIDLGPGEWTSDVDAVKEAAQKNGRMIAIEWGRLSTCPYCQALEPHITSAQFLTWAKENGVYLVSADDSKFDDVEAAKIWFSSCFEGNMIDFPTIVFIDASDLETCLGQGLFRNGQTVGEIQYEDTVESLIECFEQFLPDPPPPPEVDTKGEVVLGQDGAAKTSATYNLGDVMCKVDVTLLPEWITCEELKINGSTWQVSMPVSTSIRTLSARVSAKQNDTGKERSSDWKIKNDAGAVVFTLTIRQQGSSEPLPQVQDPVLDPASQAFEGEEFTVNCTCADAEAEIRYTIGAEPADPTEGDALWPADGLLITEESIVKVRAFMAGREPSGVVTGDYTCHSCEPTEGNDDFANAEEITGLKGSTTCSNVGATREVGEPSHWAGSLDATVWWKWTATSDGPMTVDTKGSSFDTAMAVYTGTDVSHLTLVDNNDDAEGDDIVDVEMWSRVVFEAVEGETYYIVVTGSEEADNNGEGEVKLNWAFGEDPQPVEEFYTIRFESGDETATGEMEELQAQVGKFVKLPQNKFALDDKRFDGWYCAATEKKYGDAFEVLDLAEVGQTATLVAQWRTKKEKPVQYEIRFASGEGEGAETTDPVLVGVGMTYWLAECPFKGEEGQTFIGWLCRETGEFYEDREEIIDLAKNGGTVTLIAQWEGGQANPDFYTIVFAPGEGGTGTMAPMQVQTNAAVKLSKCAFVNKNPAVAFAEWKSDAGKTYKDEQEVRDLAKVGETVTLTAQWGCAPFSQLDDGLSEDEKKDVSIGFAAYVYDGHLVATNDDNSVVGVVTVKVDKKGKTTATVTRIGVTKLTYKSQMPIAKGEVDLLCTKDSAKMHLTVYAGGIEGSCGPYQVTCRKNVAKENPAGYMAVEGKVWAVALKADELTATDLTSGYASLTVTGAKKGKVKVTGMLPDGTKVSASSQAEVKADGGVLIPIVAQLYSGKIGGISLALQIDGKKGSESAAEVRGAGKWKSLTGEIPWDSSQSHCEPVNVYGITRKTDMFTLEKQPAQIAGMNVATQFLHSVSNMMFSGKKWTIAKGGKIKLMGTDIVDMNASPNPGGLTLSYTPKTGAFKGKYSVYANNFGKLKKLSATVNGVIAGENGYGTAVIKNQHSIPVQIQNQK